MISRIETITAFVIAMNCGYAGLQVYLLRRLKPWPKGVGVAVCLWALVMSALFMLAVLAPPAGNPSLLHRLCLPRAVAMVWNVLFLRFLVPGIILVTLVGHRFRRTAPAAAPATDGMSRRK